MKQPKAKIRFLGPPVKLRPMPQPEAQPPRVESDPECRATVTDMLRMQRERTAVEPDEPEAG